MQDRFAGRGVFGAQVRQAGGFVFSGAVEPPPGAGLFSPTQSPEADIAEQCRASYAALTRAFVTAGISANRIVRLDHYTESQSWLSIRQRERSRFFGYPAPLASTGVPMPMTPGKRLRVAAWGHRQGPSVICPGADYGMPAIAAAVTAGDLLLLSGVLKGAQSGADEPADRSLLCRNIGQACDDILHILRRVPKGGFRPLRMEIYLSVVHAGFDALAQVRHFLAEPPLVATIRWLSGVPNNMVEVTTVAAPSGGIAEHRQSGGVCQAMAAGLWFGSLSLQSEAGASGADLHHRLIKLLETCIDPSQIARIELSAGSLPAADALAAQIADAWPSDPPTLLPLAMADPGSDRTDFVIVAAESGSTSLHR